MKRYFAILISATFVTMIAVMQIPYAADTSSAVSNPKETETPQLLRDAKHQHPGHHGEQVSDDHNHQYAQRPDWTRDGVNMGGFEGFEKDSTKSRLMVMYRLVDQLDLDEDTAAKFFPIYLTFVKSRDSLMKEHRGLIRSIVKNADDESVPVKELNKRLAELQAKEKDSDKQRTDFFNKSKKLLNDRQYIKLVVFNDKLKFELMNHFRSERRRRMNDSTGKTKIEADN